MNNIYSEMHSLNETFSRLLNKSLGFIGEWEGRAVRVIQNIPQQMQKNPTVASTVLISANVLAFSILGLIDNYLERKLKSCDQTVSTKPRIFKQIMMQGIVTGGGMLAFNVLFSRLVNYSLSPLMLTGVTILSIAIRVLMSSFKNNNILLKGPIVSPPNENDSVKKSVMRKKTVAKSAKQPPVQPEKSSIQPESVRQDQLVLLPSKQKNKKVNIPPFLLDKNMRLLLSFLQQPSFPLSKLVGPLRKIQINSPTPTTPLLQSTQLEPFDFYSQQNNPNLIVSTSTSNLIFSDERTTHIFLSLLKQASFVNFLSQQGDPLLNNPLQNLIIQSPFTSTLVEQLAIPSSLEIIQEMPQEKPTSAQIEVMEEEEEEEEEEEKGDIEKENSIFSSIATSATSSSITTSETSSSIATSPSIAVKEEQTTLFSWVTSFFNLF